MASPTLLALNSVASPPQSQGSAVAAFISKVWNILENRDYQKLVSWSECGKNVIIHDYPNFSKDILPRYFKHNNFNSFVRQLNLYGFRKVSHPEHGVLSKVQVTEPIEFWHPNFRRGHPELLYLVQRRSVKVTSEEKASELSKVLTDIHQMKGKQANITEMLVVMQQDNIHLKRELELLRERHIRQQRVLNKIIQFLVHMVYKGRLPSANRKRAPDSKILMLTDAEGVVPPAKRGRVTLDPSPQQFSFSDFDDLSTLPIDTTPALEPIDSVPPPLLPPAITPVSTSFTVTSPPSPSQHPTYSNTQYLMEPALDTSTTSSVLPVTTLSSLSSEPSTVLAASISSPPVTTLSSSSLLPALPDPATLSREDGEPDGYSSNYTPSVSFPDWFNLTGHIDSHQLELDSLPGFLSSQLSVDPTFINQFISIGDQPVPDYDAIDTARLLETLAGEDEGEMAIMREKSPQNALVPITQASLLSASHSQDIDKDEPSSSLRELLELKDTLTDT